MSFADEYLDFDPPGPVRCGYCGAELEYGGFICEQDGVELCIMCIGRHQHDNDRVHAALVTEQRELDNAEPRCFVCGGQASLVLACGHYLCAKCPLQWVEF